MSERATPIYLDHAATTGLVPPAAAAMQAALVTPGNAASLHESGRTARRLLEQSRESIAAALGARPSEVIFTGGGTESDNLAIKGIYWSRVAGEPRRRRILASGIEHHAVLDSVLWLADVAGADVTWLPVSGDGTVDVGAVRAEIAAAPDDIALVSVMWANNEIGTVQPIGEIAAICTEFAIPFHTDAIAAAGHIPVDFAASGVSALSVAAHKFGGPHGIGALLLGRSVGATPLLHGGGHERDIRSGTPDVVGAAGMAAALATATADLDWSIPQVRDMTTYLTTGIQRVVPDTIINSVAPQRLPSIAHVSFAGAEGDSLLMLLDARGIECSTGSACTAGVARPSHVLLAMGIDPAVARGSLRFSLGPTTTVADVDAVVAVLPEVVERARMAGLSMPAPATSGGAR